MSGPAGGRLPAAQPPPKRQRAGGGAGSAFPLAGCLVFMPHASQLSAAGIDPSSWIVGIPRLGGSLTHNHRRAASVTHALVPTVAPPGEGTTWAWLPAELLPGSTVAAHGLHYVIPAWAADCIAWRERRPEVGYVPAERYNGVPAAATTVAHAAAAAAAHGAAAMPMPAAAAPAARRASHAAPASTAAQRTNSAAAAAAAHAPAAAHAAPAVLAHAVGAAAPPSELVQASFHCLNFEAAALDLRVLLSASRASAASMRDIPPLLQFSGHTARCVGCLLGVMCGDVLGAPVEAKGRNHWTKIR